MTLAFAPLDGETAWLTVGLDTELPCRQYDPDLWFADTPADLEVAKTLCGACPLRVECLSGAVERAEPWGVWGGEIFERGAVVPRKRPRGRPRKDELAQDTLSRVDVAHRLSDYVGLNPAAGLGADLGRAVGAGVGAGLNSGLNTGPRMVA